MWLPNILALTCLSVPDEGYSTLNLISMLLLLQVNDKLDQIML